MRGRAKKKQVGEEQKDEAEKEIKLEVRGGGRHREGGKRDTKGGRVTRQEGGWVMRPKGGWVVRPKGGWVVRPKGGWEVRL